MILTGHPPPDELAIIGREMRVAAMANPCHSAADCANLDLFRRLGEDYTVSVALEMFPMGKKAIPPPRWHASVAILIVTGSFNEFGMPEQAVMESVTWPHEYVSIAREILGYLLNAVILDEHQPVQDILSGPALHWFTRAAPILEQYGNSPH